MKNKIFGFVLYFTIFTVDAAPIYLECKAISDKETHAFSTTLDETTGKITHKNNNGYAFNADGFFSSDEVSYKSVNCTSPICTTNQYTINRIDLSVTYIYHIEAINKSLGISAREIISKGICTISKAPERKF